MSAVDIENVQEQSATDKADEKPVAVGSEGLPIAENTEQLPAAGNVAEPVSCLPQEGQTPGGKDGAKCPVWLKEFLSSFKLGKRKLKSVLAVFIVFSIWQLLRLWQPMLEVHPVFGYYYAVIEMRKTSEHTVRSGRSRLIGTIIGASLAFLFLFIGLQLKALTDVKTVRIIIEISLVLIGIPLAISLARAAKCGSMCSVAATVFIACVISHSDSGVYRYAAFRALHKREIRLVLHRLV